MFLWKGWHRIITVPLPFRFRSEVEYTYSDLYLKKGKYLSKIYKAI